MNKPPVEKPEKNDIRIINIQNKFGRLFGLVPLYTDHRTGAAKVYTSSILCLFTCFLIFTIYNRALLYHHYSLLQVILDVIQMLSQISFMFVGLFGSSFRYLKNWKTLFDLIHKIEKKFDTENFIVRKNMYLYNLEIVLYHLVYLTMQIYENYIWLSQGGKRYICAYIMFRIVMYYQFLVLVFVCNFSQMLKRRYNYLNRLTIEALRSSSANQSIEKLKNVKTMYHMLHSVLKQVNTVLGWQVFFILQGVVLTILDTSYIALEYFSDHTGGGGIMFILVYPSVYIVCAVALVMGCDGVERSGKNITTSCYFGLGNMEKSDLREELLVMIRYTEKFSPKFSAAGFFRINQGLLSSLFSSTITYFIVIIQFKQALH